MESNTDELSELVAKVGYLVWPFKGQYSLVGCLVDGNIESEMESHFSLSWFLCLDQEYE